MGADITCFVEAKEKDDDTWFVLIQKLPEPRNYEWFAALAGVRGEGPKPLGLPDDVSKTVMYENNLWGLDAHSESFMDYETFMRIYKDYNLNETYMAQLKMKQAAGEPFDNYEAQDWYEFNNFEDWITRGKDMKNFDYRVVFWFDN